jgi:hypothetical protein
MAGFGHRGLFVVLDRDAVRSATDSQSRVGGLRSDHRFVPATGRDSLRRGGAMREFNERPILYILLWAAAGLGFIGFICYWIWNWLNN